MSAHTGSQLSYVLDESRVFSPLRQNFADALAFFTGSTVDATPETDLPGRVDVLTVDVGSTAFAYLGKAQSRVRPILVQSENSSARFGGLLPAALLTGGLVASYCGDVLFDYSNTAVRFDIAQTSGAVPSRARQVVKQPRALALLQGWLDERQDPAIEDAELAVLIRELNADRLGNRRLFETS